MADARQGEVVLVPTDRIVKGGYRHPPFGEEYRPFFERMSSLFGEVCPGSPEDWEDDFRRDRNPEREMDVWNKIAGFYEHFTRTGTWTLGQKEELLGLLLACVNAGPTFALNGRSLCHLARPLAKKVVEHVVRATNGRTWPLLAVLP
jgi:hypothetical protein